MNNNLFSSLELGPIKLQNRIVMAPMTRARAGEEGIPNDLIAEYYAQRATAGLIISEATQVAPEAKGYPFTPGIHSDAQVAGWQKVTDAVHAKGGRIFLQLWHVGRVALQSVLPNNDLPVGPSAIQPAGKTFTGDPYPTPRALELSEIPGIVQMYRDGAEHARKAGFDGVEVHAANGYLIDQFLRDGTNHRTDAYGGSIENRARLLLEVTQAVIEVWGKDRVGVRLSPTGAFNDMRDSNPLETFKYAASKLSELGIVYLHVIEPVIDSHMMAAPNEINVAPDLRKAFQGIFMVNGGFNRETGDEAIESGAADLVSYGVPFIANPDLVARFESNAALATPDQATMYGGASEGYIDYPTLDLVNA